MSDGWHTWWDKNSEFQLRKKYSKVVGPMDQGVTMISRQYANWNGNLYKHQAENFANQQNASLPD